MAQVEASGAAVVKVKVEKSPFVSTKNSVAVIASWFVPKKKSFDCSPGPIVYGLMVRLSLPFEKLKMSGKVA